MKTVDDVMTILFCVMAFFGALALALVYAGHLVLSILSGVAAVLVYGVAVGVFFGSNIK